MNEEDTPQIPEEVNHGTADAEAHELQDRRDFLGSLGKWSGASILAAAGSAAWIAAPGRAEAGLWINRPGGWINRRGGWINGPRGGAGWINRYGGGGAGWINRYGGGGAGWINGPRGGGRWINRRGGGGWINRR